MKKIICFFAWVFVAWASEILEVSAERFSGNEKDGISILEGKVDIKKGSDRLYASKVTLYTNADRKIEKMIAEGDVKFFVITQDGRKIHGSSDVLIYRASSGEYHLKKNANIKEEGKENAIRGEEIFFNHQTGYIDVKGGENKPAKLIFNLEETKS